MTFFERPILAIETSCDETSAAVVNGREILSNLVASQVEMHRKWGGVVPEAAARAHVEALVPVIEEALETASMTKLDVGAIAVTNRPGLVGALSVGVTGAKALAFALRIPLIGIHHLEGHILSTMALENPPPFPHTCLIVSGGHTEIVDVQAPGAYRIVGQTIDDAAGEAFDKGARLLGLGYPGGRAIQELAREGNPKRYPLPKGLAGETIDFSFSGLKTAVLRLVEKEGDALNVADAAASLQHVIVSVLTERALRAAETLNSKALTLVGGVAANEALRSSLARECRRAGIAFATPPIGLCTDNAAMIGLAASLRLAKGERSDFELDAYPNSELPS
ncbi:MAG TPA: tRNA (adenosine(37)-N6)-threonylcarbamoyltransferase complex transferase subunit TsaD [Fimbriimonas sp.]|nr:tRNA (adenosine(37)-N6)-threonylcarbamoyltransferase complex transferase subunit TsaD [Fimbriimonas sp.]